MECGLTVHFLERKQELGHHVPIDTSKSLEGKHRAAATSERAMVKYFFPEI